MNFTKMHGIGNDYIYIYGKQSVDLSEFAIKYGKYHTGIGSDGVIQILEGGSVGEIPCDFTMVMYNADGSRGAMCGNGIRCVGKYVYDKGHTKKTSFNVATDSGVRKLELKLGVEGRVDKVQVNMGKSSGMKEYSLNIGDERFCGHFVSVGNPHFVIEWDDPYGIDLEKWGSQIEKNELFAPSGVNVEFYTMTEDGFFFRVWERGSGETLSCGTGACATYVVAQEKGQLKLEEVTAYLLGGDLKLWMEGEDIIMEGGTETVFEGEV